MDLATYDLKISRLEDEFKTKKNEMEEIIREYIKAAENFSKLWAKETIKEMVISKPDISKELGKTGLTNLKSDCRNLIEEIPAIVEDELNKDKYWKHRELLKTSEDKIYPETHLYPSEFKKEIENAFLTIFEHVGKLLFKYKYIESKSSGIWEKSYEGIKYRGRLDLNSDLNNIAENYFENYKIFNRLLFQLIRTKKEKAETEVKNIWDDID